MALGKVLLSRARPRRLISRPRTPPKVPRPNAKAVLQASKRMEAAKKQNERKQKDKEQKPKAHPKPAAKAPRKKPQNPKAKAKPQKAKKAAAKAKNGKKVEEPKPEKQRASHEHGPMQQNMRLFFESKRAEGHSYRECQKLWKVSEERQAVIMTLSASERKRRRFD